MKPKRIFIIRHGQSAANINWDLLKTLPDYKVPLTDLGRQQARAAGQALAKIFNGAPVAVYQSPFLRTRQTADEIISQFSPGQVTRRREDPRLREQEFGNYQHPESAKIDAEREAFGIFFYRIPGGESGADVYDRCTGFLSTFYRDVNKHADFPDNALIVCHGLTLRLLLMRWLHWGIEYFEATKNPDNCQFFEMRLKDDGHYELAEPFPMKVR